MLPPLPGRRLVSALVLLLASVTLTGLGPAPVSGAQVQSTVTVAVTTPSPTVGQEMVFEGTVQPAAARPVFLQQRIGKEWVTGATGRTDRSGAYRLSITPAVAAVHTFRTFAPATKRFQSATRKVVAEVVPAEDDPDPGTCAPRIPAVDRQATEETVCLLATLDRWVREGRMGVGQQVNIDSDAWRAPLAGLGSQRVAVVGFDLEELRQAAANGIDRIPDLVALARAGHVLTASWHADNPWTGAYSDDQTSRQDVPELLDPSNAGQVFYDRFWGHVTWNLQALSRLQDAGIPVILRPFHEANAYFWWGRQSPATYRGLWSALQARASAAGVHNLLWHYAAVPRTYDGVVEPVSLLPERVDLAGLDTYECELPTPEQAASFCGGAGDYSQDQVILTSYEALAAEVPRMSLSEVGPFFSDGSWNPQVITDTIRARGLSPAYSLLWFDDATGKKAIASLTGGPAWLASCVDGVCGLS